MTKSKFTPYQISAIISLLIVAVWGAWVSWLPMTRPMGINFTEILFLSTLVPIYIILLPFYGLRVRWSYISGIVVLLGLFAGFTKSILDQTFFFSATTYNFATVGALLTALGCIYFSTRSYLELPPSGWLKSTLGIGGLLAISVLAVWQVSANQMKIENYFLEQVIRGVQSRTGDIENLDDKIDALMIEGHIPSIAAGIVVDDEIAWLQDYGGGAGLDKLFDIGSIAKSFTATAVLQLYESGLVDLDDDINQYLPFDVRHPDYPDVPITVRMLLTNQSCLAHNTAIYYAFSMGPNLRQWGVENRGWENLPELENISYPEFLAGYLVPGEPYYLDENWGSCQPGTNFIYSTPGFDLLGYLVEQVSGQPIDDYLQENIFTPLEMNNTTTTPLDTSGRMAIPFERWYGVLAKTNVQLPLSQRKMVGGGGLYSTVGDLSNFLLAHMNKGEFEGYQLLQPKTVSLMHTKVSETNADFMQVGYGHGWSIYQKEPRQMWDITFHPRGYQGHGGRYWGYNGVMYMVDDADGAYGYILLMNHSMIGSMDQPMFFSIQFNIQDLILQEAHRMYQDS